jgi:hypothetical protein
MVRLNVAGSEHGGHVKTLIEERPSISKPCRNEDSIIWRVKMGDRYWEAAEMCVAEILGGWLKEMDQRCIEHEG